MGWIQSLRNPFRDWNLYKQDTIKNLEANRFKVSETLLGIETLQFSALALLRLRFKVSETLLGIETIHLTLIG